MNNQPVLYYQTDRRWADVDYSAKGESTTIGRSGCGPTCMSMVIATWADKNMTPVEACAWALSHGYKAVNQGTYYSYFKPHGAVYGILAEQLNGSNLRNMTAKAAAPYHEKAAQAIRNGDLVICCMGPGLWTSGGHFILLWDIQGDTAYINDPASSRTARTRGSLARLQKEVKYYFICHKPEKEEVDDDMMTQEQFNEMFNSAMDNYLSELAKKDDAPWGEEWEAAKAWAEDTGLIKGDQYGNKMYQSWPTRQTLALMFYRQHKKEG